MTAIEAALREIVARGGDPPPASVASRPFAYESSAPLFEVELVHADGRRRRLLAKRIGWAALSEAARLAKRASSFDPLREPWVYERVLPAGEPGPPSLYGWVRTAADECLLAIELIAGNVLWQLGEAEPWERAAAWLARNHARLREFDPRPAATHLLDLDPAHLSAWPALAAQRASERRLPAAADIARIAAAYAPVVELLRSLPRTVLHNEFFPSNVLVTVGASPRVAPVDWELAARGPALIDLAALMSGEWPADAPRLASAYREALPAGDPLGLSDAEFERGLAACRLHLALRVLGSGRAGWSPPTEHRHDWAAEAISAADSLGL